jgi:hypothetical protein
MAQEMRYAHFKDYAKQRAVQRLPPGQPQRDAKK